ncbi:MAG: molybdenum cofactor biosynthesis protein [Candidatus Promineifilaceae bacterium]|jgi:molybdopterin converting factor subunit 1
MNIEVKLFATLRDRAGHNSVSCALEEPASVRDLLDVLAATHEELAASLPSALVAVNKQFAFPDTLLHEDDEIALFPPVSGGESMAHPTYFAISADEIDFEAIYQQIGGPDVGAIVSFTGFVRGQTNRQGLPPQTLYLEYEAYSGMAEEKMAQIAREIWQQWPLVKGVAIVQRIGHLEIRDITTFIACAAGHRDQGAFEAARYGIDRLKEIVPVWKREVGPNSSTWVEGSYKPTDSDNE